MMAFDPVTQDLNLKHLRAAGIAPDMVDLAHKLGISNSYADQLLRGSKPISVPIRAKLDALIAAKGDGPVEEVETKFMTDSHPRIGREPAEPTPVFAPVIGTGFRVEGVPGGGYRITQTVAECLDQAFARAICDMLNKEGG